MSLVGDVRTTPHLYPYATHQYNSWGRGHSVCPLEGLQMEIQPNPLEKGREKERKGRKERKDGSSKGERKEEKQIKTKEHVREVKKISRKK